MAINKYSLAEYTVTIGRKDAAEKIIIGGYGDNGQGSFVGRIAISRNSDLWKTEGDATGSWVHSRSYDRTGTVSLDIKQISDQVIQLMMMTSSFDAGGTLADESEGFIITVSKGGEEYAVCNDCYPTKVPDQEFGSDVGDQTWEFTCGQVLFKATTSNYPFN